LKNSDGFISKHLNRKISMKITSFIISHEIPLTPNGVSLISFLLALLTFPLYFFQYPIFAGILVQISSILDGVDGELARATGRSSNYGAFFDTMLDRFSDFIIIFGASLYAWNLKASEEIFLVAFLAISGSILVSYLHSEGRRLLGIHPGTFGNVPILASRDIRLFVLFLFSLFGMVFEALMIIGALSLSYVVLKTSEIILNFEREQ